MVREETFGRGAQGSYDGDIRSIHPSKMKEVSVINDRYVPLGDLLSFFDSVYLLTMSSLLSSFSCRSGANLVIE